AFDGSRVLPTAVERGVEVARLRPVFTADNRVVLAMNDDCGDLARAISCARVQLVLWDVLRRAGGDRAHLVGVLTAEDAGEVAAGAFTCCEDSVLVDTVVAGDLVVEGSEEGDVTCAPAIATVRG